MALTKAKITKLTKRGSYCDGGGLYLQVAKGGSKSWIQRIMINGKRRSLGLGGYPLISLTEARKSSIELRRDVYKGLDPIAQKRQAKMPLFEEVVKEAYQKKKQEFDTELAAKQWKRNLENHVVPKFGNRRINEIDQTDMINFLKPLLEAKPAMAKKLRQQLKAVFNLAIAKKYLQFNPAGDAIDAALPKITKAKNHAALNHEKVGDFLHYLVHAENRALNNRLAMRFVILTACRLGQACKAKWDEIDFERAIWNCPVENMKMRKEHRVPLSDAALDVLREARELHDGDLIFPAARSGKIMQSNNLANIIKGAGLKGEATTHGFRSSFRSWAAENNVADEVAEMCIAHAVQGVKGDYQRSDIFELRRPVMQEWADYLIAP